MAPVVDANLEAAGNVADEEQAGIEEEHSRYRHKYCVEENIYGFVIASPTRGSLNILLMVLFYVTIFGITAIITNSVLSDFFETVDSLGEICAQNGSKYDCRPPGYDKLQQFSQLDMDGDGVWSVTEARSAGMLPQFRGLHDQILEAPELLSSIAPARDAVPNLYCYFWQQAPDPLDQLSRDEQLALANASGHLTQEIWDYCGPWPYCLTREICPHSGMLEAPYRSSREVYMDLTQSMSTFPQSVYSAIKANLLPPCRLVDPDLCGNAEVEGVLAAVPMWADADPEMRVSKCQVFVKTQCPRLLGTSYVMAKIRVEAACGVKHFQATQVAPSTPKPSLIPTSRCVDNATYGRETVSSILAANPAMTYLVTGFERLTGLPAGAMSMNMDCDFGIRLGFCYQTTGVAHPDNPGTFIETLKMFGRACPETCCSGGHTGCPSACIHMAGTNQTLTTSFGSVSCVGASCGMVRMESDGSSGVLRLEAGGNPYRRDTGGFGDTWTDAAKIIINSDIALRMQTPKLKLGESGDVTCSQGRVEIDNVKYCAGNNPGTVLLPRRIGGVIELNWRADQHCSNPAECGFSIMVMDAGEASTYSVGTMEFENAENYAAIMSFQHGVFFILVLYLWTGYVCIEINTAFDYMRCTLFCPSVLGTGRRRACLFAGVCLPRMVLAVWVYFVGCVFLVSAPDFLDLVLNSTALAFILEFDEILYRVMVPRSAMQAIQDMDALQWGAPSHASRFQARKATAAVALGTLGPIIPAVTIIVLQYTWSKGFIAIDDQMRCACQLEGNKCVDAVLA